jgi:hypothetical protein
MNASGGSLNQYPGGSVLSKLRRDADVPVGVRELGATVLELGEGGA